MALNLRGALEEASKDEGSVTKEDRPTSSLKSLLGSTVSEPKRRARVPELKEPTSEAITQIGNNLKPAGRPAIKAATCGAPAQVGWKTFQAQRDSLEELVKVSGCSKTDVLEIGLALAVREFQEKGTLKDVDVQLAREFGDK